MDATVEDGLLWLVFAECRRRRHPRILTATKTNRVKRIKVLVSDTNTISLVVMALVSNQSHPGTR